MKLKRILSAALSAAMLVSCMSFGGGTVVVQATTERGENIAEASNIISHSGNDGIFTIDHVMDGEGNDEQNNNERWLSKICLKGTGPDRGEAAYIVYDLGENGPRSYEGLHIRFHNQAYATDYKVYTSDVNTYAANELKTLNPESNGWTELDHKVRTAGEYRPYPLDTRQGQINTGRYLLFYFSQMRTDLSGVSNSISIREIEIYHKPIDSITLPETLDLEVDATSQLTATVTPADATYKDVTWSSDNEEVATVDASGNVTAVAPGSTVIKATCKDDRTKTATCTVNVASAVDKTELLSLLNFTETLEKDKYSDRTWKELQATKELAQGVNDDPAATQEQVKDAVDALLEAINGLDRVYTVTVNGEFYKKGEMNTPCTITAEKKEGQTFKGWKLNNKIVSVEESYTFYICGDMSFEATYSEGTEKPVKPLSANMTGTVVTKRADGKANVKFVAQLSIPEGYTLNETGLLWYGKSDLDSLYTEDGPNSKVQRVVVPRISATYQFAVTVNGIPATKTIRGVIYAKVTGSDGQEQWIYSDETSVTNN